MARNFDVNNGLETKSPFLIGVAGGTASGKVNIHIDLFSYNTLKLAHRSMSPKTNHLQLIKGFSLMSSDDFLELLFVIYEILFEIGFNHI